jgi:UDP-glucose 4-epimerase
MSDPRPPTTSGRGDRVLLLGGCGYVGSAVFDHLTARGWRVDTVDLEWFGNEVNDRNLRRDYARLTRAELEPYGSIVLLAAHSSVGMCASNRDAAFHNNVANFVALLEKVGPQQRLVYASSASVYGRTNGKAAREEDRLAAPATYYDLTKQEIDLYAQLSGLDYYGLRFGTVNGLARHLRTDVMLNRMVATSRETGTIAITNPEVHRPILGVRDLVRAVARILERPDARPGIYNLASFNATVLDLASRAADALDARVERRSGAATAYDMCMSSALFCDTFDFAFAESVESIVGSLAGGWAGAHPTSRERSLPYA